ncbi:unnamed protein product [Pleuronectes platessa]|uniref:Uncharacterized protein n=1 Tax=Pleuronectes platessa TaxID=8262 RepID=A0A9N7VG69_PLEPL|nr:unnamed protein product [Pleuronectes platessa]
MTPLSQSDQWVGGQSRITTAGECQSLLKLNSRRYQACRFASPQEPATQVVVGKDHSCFGQGHPALNGQSHSQQCLKARFGLSRWFLCSGSVAGLFILFVLVSRGSFVESADGQS